MYAGKKQLWTVKKKTMMQTMKEKILRKAFRRACENVPYFIFSSLWDSFSFLHLQQGTYFTYFSGAVSEFPFPKYLHKAGQVLHSLEFSCQTVGTGIHLYSEKQNSILSAFFLVCVCGVFFWVGGRYLLECSGQ